MYKGNICKVILLQECSWQDAHELLNSSVELLEDPGEYLKKTDSDDPRIGQK